MCAEVIQESDKTQRGATQAKIQADTAMSWLQKAVTGGFDDLGQIKQDPDLKALRGRDDFQALLTQMAEKSRSGNPR